MPRNALLGLLLGLSLLGAEASAAWNRVGQSPYWAPDSFPVPTPGESEDEIFSRLFRLRSEFYGTKDDLPLEIPLLGLWLDEANLALEDIALARRQGSPVPSGTRLLEGIGLAMSAEYGLDPLSRQERLEVASAHLSELEGEPELSVAARVNRALVDLELGNGALADSLAGAPGLPENLQQVLLHASRRAALSWPNWRDRCERAIVSGDAKTASELMRNEPLRAVAFAHIQLDGALVPAQRDSFLGVVDFCLESVPDSIPWDGVATRAERLRNLDAGLARDADSAARLRFARTHDLPLMEGICLAQGAETLAKGNRYDEATEYLDRARRICEDQYDFYLDFKTRSVRRHVAYNTGDVSTLRATSDAFETALVRYHAVDPVNDLARGLLETLLGNPSQGEEYLARSYRLALRRDVLPYRAVALENLAFTYFTLGQDSTVVRYADELTRLKELAETDTTVTRTNREEVEDSWLLGRTLVAAIEVARGGAPDGVFDGLAEEALRLGTPRSVVEIRLAAARAYTEDPAEAKRHATLARDLAASCGAVDLLWKAWALQGRAELTQGDLALATASLDSARTLFDRQRRSALREDVRARFNIPARFVFSTSIDAALAQQDVALAYRLDEEGRARALLDRLDSDRPEPVATAAEVRATLDANAMLLQTRVESDRIRVWSLTREELGYHEIAVADSALAADAAHWVRSLQDGDPDDRERRLFDLLLTPLADELATHDRLILVPDGPLRALPFGLLQGPRARLFETHVLSYEISGSVRWRTLRRGTRIPPAAEPVLVGVEQGVVTDGHRFPPLPKAADECRCAAAQLRSPSLLLDEQATVGEVIRVQGGASLLHFACHAAFDAGGRAFLQLTPGPDDGRLTEARVRGLDLHHTGMVTLSACETALPQNLNADWSPGDLAGLSASFLAAGAPGVVATLWKIDDDAAFKIMCGFYENLLTMDAPHALSASQRTFAAQQVASSGKIRKWGAFCIYGTPLAP